MLGAFVKKLFSVEHNSDRRQTLKFLGFGAVAATTASLPSIVLASEKYEPKYKTIAHEVLGLEYEVGVVDEDYRLLDEIIDEAKARITVKEQYTKADAIEIFQTIDRILEEQGYESKLNSPALINPGFKTQKDGKKHIDCDRYSFICLGIADELNLPMAVTLAPSHIFPRMHLSDGTYANWESLKNVFVKNLILDGRSIGSGVTELLNRNQSDDDYIGNKQITQNQIDKGLYLRSLGLREDATFGLEDNRNELFALVLGEIGYHFANEIKNYDRAVQYYDKAIELGFAHPEFFYNVGMAHSNREDYEKAREFYEKVAELDEDNFKAYEGIGITYLFQEEHDKAIAAFEERIIRKSDSLGYSNLGAALYSRSLETGSNADKERAIESFEYALKLNPNDQSARYNLNKIRGSNEQTKTTASTSNKPKTEYSSKTTTEEQEEESSSLMSWVIAAVVATGTVLAGKAIADRN